MAVLALMDDTVQTPHRYWTDIPHIDIGGMSCSSFEWARRTYWTWLLDICPVGVLNLKGASIGHRLQANVQVSLLDIASKTDVRCHVLQGMKR